MAPSGAAAGGGRGGARRGSAVDHRGGRATKAAKGGAGGAADRECLLAHTAERYGACSYDAALLDSWATWPRTLRAQLC